MKKAKKQPSSPTAPTKPQNSPQRVMPPLGFNAFADEEEVRKSAHSRAASQGQGSGPGPGGPGRRGPTNVGPSSYTKEELHVLR